jgi:hypothetical protein
LMTDFINLKIKSTQYFRCDYINSMYCSSTFILYLKKNKNGVAQFHEYISSTWPGTPRRHPTTVSARGEPVHPPRLTPARAAVERKPGDRIKTASSSLSPLSLIIPLPLASLAACSPRPASDLPPRW